MPLAPSPGLGPESICWRPNRLTASRRSPAAASSLPKEPPSQWKSHARSPLRSRLGHWQPVTLAGVSCLTFDHVVPLAFTVSGFRAPSDSYLPSRPLRTSSLRLGSPFGLSQGEVCARVVCGGPGEPSSPSPSAPNPTVLGPGPSGTGNRPHQVPRADAQESWDAAPHWWPAWWLGRRRGPPALSNDPASWGPAFAPAREATRRGAHGKSTDVGSRL